MQSSSLDNCVRVVHRLSPNFPFNPSSGWDVEQSLEILYGLLPPKLRAWSLCETFQEHGTVGSLIIDRSEVVAELLTPIYRYLGDGKQHRQGKPPPLSCHKLAVLFLVFALGALVDLTLPPYNTEADNYFDLGCAALNLHHIFKSPEMATVQAVLLMSTYLSHGGRRYTMDGAWTLSSMAAKLAQSVSFFLVDENSTDVSPYSSVSVSYHSQKSHASDRIFYRSRKFTMENGCENVKQEEKTVLGGFPHRHIHESNSWAPSVNPPQLR